ncbi:MAG TPA: NAD(P)-dependent oxidoreductase [Burkholderiales bacterium]|nr:NAD(P)-dependent oxidoreductase [Burkholderiales bacterium]
MIGFIGLGVMGEPICRNLAKKSAEKVLAFDLKPAPLERLKANGVEAAASVREIAERCQMVFLSLPGVTEVKTVCAGPGSLMLHMHSGGYVVDLSTTTVALARDLHSRFTARGIYFADAPVARTRSAAEKGTLLTMVGSTEPVFKRLRPWLSHFATDIAHCGATGAGQATKLINNMVLFQNVLVLAEALALARKAGLSATKVFDALSKGSADSFALRNHGMKAMLADNFPELAYSVDYALKDMGYLLEFAKQARAELAGAKNAMAALERAAAGGNGKKYFPVLAKTV